MIKRFAVRFFMMKVRARKRIDALHKNLVESVMKMRIASKDGRRSTNELPSKVRACASYMYGACMFVCLYMCVFACLYVYIDAYIPACLSVLCVSWGCYLSCMHAHAWYRSRCGRTCYHAFAHMHPFLDRKRRRSCGGLRCITERAKPSSSLI